jgi:hypothetical protein
MAYRDTIGHAHALARRLGIRRATPYSGGYGTLLRQAGIIGVVLGTHARC